MNASSESGECASLISTGEVSVFEAACWPGMGWWFLFLAALADSRPCHFNAKSYGRRNCPSLYLFYRPQFSNGFPLLGTSEGEWKDTRRRGLRDAGPVIF